jgi:hypothetical protein
MQDVAKKSRAVSPRRDHHDEWIMVALLAAALFQSGAAFYQMNRMTQTGLKLQSGMEVAVAPKPAAEPLKGPLLATTAGTRHRD